MKKISLVFTMLLTVLMGSLVITSCSSDDEEGEGGSVEDVSSILVGGWACIYQEREQDNLYQDSYEPSTNMFIRFNADGTGSVRSVGDELFEVYTGKTDDKFSWIVKNKNGINYVVTDIFGEMLQINKLTSSTLEMTWYDALGDYRIYCKFIKFDN